MFKHTPASAKFSRINELKLAKHSSPSVQAEVEIQSALVRHLQQQDKAEDDEKTDEKISRYRYARLVLEISAQTGNFHSFALFVVSTLNELKQRGDVNVALRAAVGTWALQRLSAQSPSGPLACIAEALLPAIYYRYNPSILSQPSFAIRTQLRDDEALITSNPFFTHTMLVEKVATNENKITELDNALRKALYSNDHRRNYVVRVIKARQMHLVRTSFRAWQVQARQTRRTEFVREITGRQFTKEISALRLKAAFYQWKSILELSRNHFLTERLHDAAFQLENAKNQFQLQCYRSDRLINTAKTAEEKLQKVEEANKGLMQLVEHNREEEMRKAQEFQEELANSTNAAVQLVKEYQRLASVLICTQQKPALPFGSPSEPTCEEEEEKEGENHLLPKKHGPPEENRTALQVLREWCNAVLKEAQGAKFTPITTFGSDFANGYVYEILLHQVFLKFNTQNISRMTNVEARLQRIAEICEKVPLVYVLKPEDFVTAREDRIVQSLCELYMRYLDNHWKAITEEVKSHLTAKLDTSSDAGWATKKVEFDDFRSFVKEGYEKLEEFRDRLTAQNKHAQELAQHKELLTEMQVNIAAQRRKGMLLSVLDKNSAEAFWALNARNLEDLQGSNRVKQDISRCAEALEKPLQAILQEYVSTTAHIFYFYAGENARLMLEYSFWNLVEVAVPLDGALTKETVAEIFDRVASPQLAGVFKAASDRKSGMSRDMLFRVARQEISIRIITPLQYVEMLVRMAVAMHGKEHGVVDCVRIFMSQLVLPTKDSILPVIRSFYEPEAQRVVAFFKDDLARIFFFYLRKQELSSMACERAMATCEGGRFAALLSDSFFIKVLEDCNFLLDRVYPMESSIDDDANGPLCFMTSMQALQVVEALRKNCPRIQPGRMTFTIFLETFSLIAHYWCPNPLVPDSRKLAAFIARCICLLNTRHADSILVLGMPPHISLEGGKDVDLFSQ